MGPKMEILEAGASIAQKIARITRKTRDASKRIFRLGLNKNNPKAIKIK